MPMKKCSGFDSSSALNYTKKRMWIAMVNGFMYIYIMHFGGDVKTSSHLTTQDRLLSFHFFSPRKVEFARWKYVLMHSIRIRM